MDLFDFYEDPTMPRHDEFDNGFLGRPPRADFRVVGDVPNWIELPDGVLVMRPDFDRKIP